MESAQYIAYSSWSGMSAAKILVRALRTARLWWWTIAESIIRSGNSRAVSGSAIAGIVSGPMTVGVSVPAPEVDGGLPPSGRLSCRAEHEQVDRAGESSVEAMT